MDRRSYGERIDRWDLLGFKDSRLAVLLCLLLHGDNKPWPN